jgi:hypothetical protein
MRFRKIFIKITLILVLPIFISCKNYYNEMVAWSNNLEQGLDIETVKKLQPDFLEIDWESPLVINDEKWYLITEIDWNWDPLEMSNFLVFKEDRYMWRESKK